MKTPLHKKTSCSLIFTHLRLKIEPYTANLILKQFLNSLKKWKQRVIFTNLWVRNFTLKRVFFKYLWSNQSTFYQATLNPSNQKCGIHKTSSPQPVLWGTLCCTVLQARHGSPSSRKGVVYRILVVESKYGKKIFKKPIRCSIPMSCIIHVLREQCHAWGLDWWAFRWGRLTSPILLSNGINLKYQINIYKHVCYRSKAGNLSQISDQYIQTCLLKIKPGNLAIELNHEKFSWKDFLESTLNFKAKFLSFLKIFML
jgi:hypothetical protein